LVGEFSKTLFTLPKRELGHHLLGDIGVRADQAYRPAILIALDGGFDRNPPRFVVARPDDPVLHRVVPDLARDSVTEFLFGGRAIIGMDALDPGFVGFVSRIRRQSMNLQIFRRPTIAETGTQIDLKTADPADLLHAREFSFAFAQGGSGEVFPGHVAANHEHTADAVVLVDRAVAVGPVDLLQPAVARDRNELVLMPGRTAATQDLLDLRADDRPDFGPAFPAALTECARVALRSHGLAVGFVIKLDELGAPPDEHRVIGIEQDTHRGAQTLRPTFRRPERTCRPVIGPRQRAHLPAAGEEVRSTRLADFQHTIRSVASSAQSTSRNLTACHKPNKRAEAALVPNYWLVGGTKRQRPVAEGQH
jgi:hypothetical protein